jgi:hypothetical protein
MRIWRSLLPLTKQILLNGFRKENNIDTTTINFEFITNCYRFDEHAVF